MGAFESSSRLGCAGWDLQLLCCRLVIDAWGDDDDWVTILILLPGWVHKDTALLDGCCCFVTRDSNESCG
jgi:hypothetical protein